MPPIFKRRLLIAAATGLALTVSAGGACAAPPKSAPAEFPTGPVAPVGAPNVIVIMTDDVGFASATTMGGLIPTPTMDRLAKDGLTYANFHTTGLCSPSRAALLTGRNHHAVGFGGVADFARADPGYNSLMPKSAATLGQMLKGAGWSTAFFGKNHNVPTWQSGPLGPFDQWASGLGFDYFYGFHGGHTDQFAPMLVENHNFIEPPKDPDYVFDRDMADHAIQWLRDQRVQQAGKPFFLYYAPGSAHIPNQAPKAWLDKFRGKFDMGWDAYRAEVLERQKRMGIVPATARLADRPPEVPAWDTLSADQKKVYVRLMEAYAASLAYCDEQMGRIVGELQATGQLDNTLIVYVQGDNGATPEGEATGAFNGTARQPGGDFPYALAHLDEIGGPKSYPGIPTGWAVALNTPFPYYKMVASRLGGVKNGMVLSWPKRIQERGVRPQFAHLVDIAPTVLELAGIKPPAVVNGVRQVPFDGVSLTATLRAASTPLPRKAQYFEIAGNAALYKDGWLAASPVLPLGRENATAPAAEPKWQLYDLNSDPSQTTDVAGRYPAKLAELRTAFAAEAKRNRLDPISADTRSLLMPEMRPEITARAGTYRLYPSTQRYAEGVFPSIHNRSWTVTADVDLPSGSTSGALITRGGQFSGWGLVMLKGAPNFVYRMASGDAAVTRLTGPALSPGRHRITVSFKIDGVGYGKGGALQMMVDGKPVASAIQARTIPFKFSPEDGTVGWDAGSALVDDYPAPFPFEGTLHSVEVTLDPVQTPNAAKARQ